MPDKSQLLVEHGHTVHTNRARDIFISEYDAGNTTGSSAGSRKGIGLDLTTYGGQIAGAGTYYMDVSGLNLDGLDADASGEMHVALQNLSAATKQTTDKVMIDIYYEPRVAMVGM